MSLFGLKLNPRSTCKVRLADQSSLRSLGIVHARDMIVDGIQWSGPFVVLPNISRHHFILGMPWLRDTGASIDFVTREITYRATPKDAIKVKHSSHAEPSRPHRPPRPHQLSSLSHHFDTQEEEFPDVGIDPESEMARSHSEFEALNVAHAELSAIALEPPSPTDSTDGRPSSAESHESLAPGESEDKTQRLRLAKRLLDEFKDVFPDELPDGLPPQRSSDFPIKLLDPNAKPPSRAPYAMSKPELDQLKADLDEWKRKGWVQLSDSPYGAPCRFVRKSDSSRRLVVDYRLLNQNTIRDEAGLPLPEEMFNRLSGSRFWSKIDLRSGYYQVRINPADVHKTAFRCRFGHYEFKVMPFGLTNAPSFFMRIMHEVLQPLLDTCVVVFLDDILIYSNTLQEHEQHLRQVLRSLRSHKLYAKLSKCSLVASEVTFLGHEISRKGFSMQQSKTEVIATWPQPKTVKDIRQFVGMCQFYRKFIDNFSGIVVPLTDLTKKIGKDEVKSRAPVIWNDKAEAAFDTIKRSMQAAPTLIPPDHTQPFFLHTDASDFAIGAALGQEVPGVGMRPIGFMSRKLIPAETRYPVHDRELLAIVRGLQAFRHIIDGAKVTVITDHSALTHFFTQPHLTSRQLRWSLFLSQFNVNLKYEPGKTNVVADALSRKPDLQDSANPAPVFIDRNSPEAAQYAIVNAIELLGSNLVDEVKAAQQKDELCLAIIKDPRCAENSSLRLQMIGGALRHNDLLFVPGNQELKSKILYEAHDSPTAGHGGQAKTLWLVTTYYWWPKMGEDIKRYIEHCNRCQHVKASTRPPLGKLQPLPRPIDAWTDIAIDFIGPLPITATGHNAIMVVVDRASKYAHFIPTTTQATGEDVWRMLQHEVVRLHGLPASIVSDRDSRFTGKFWQNLQKELRVELRMSSAFHPQTDGQVERLNRVLEDYLRCYVSSTQDDWDTKLDAAELCYNNTLHSSLGVSPHMFLHGCRARTPLAIRSDERLTTNVPTVDDHLQRIMDAQERAHVALDRARDHMKHTADKRRTAESFKVGDKVLIDTTHIRLPIESKLAERYLGPFTIVEVINPNAYRLKLPPTWRIFDVINISRLKRYKAPNKKDFPHQPTDDRPAPVSVDDGAPASQHYEVEAILKSRTHNRKKQYYIKWRGYPHSDNQWVDAKDFNAPELLAEFNKRPATSTAAADASSDTDSLCSSSDSLTSSDDEPAANVTTRSKRAAQPQVTSPHPVAIASPEPSAPRRATVPLRQGLSPKGPTGHPEMDRVVKRLICIAHTKKGRRCTRPTRRGVYCWQHLQMISNLRIKPSNIAGAGLGLFSGPEPIKSGAGITEYTGPLIKGTADELGGDYALQVNRNHIIAGGGSDNVGSFANDCLTDNKNRHECSINSKLVANQNTRTARLVASKRIPPHTEICTKYGARYWKDKFEHEARLKSEAEARMRDPHTHAISVTEAPASPSSSAQGAPAPTAHAASASPVSYANAHSSSLPHLSNYKW